MSQISLLKQNEKEIADLGFFGDLKQKERELKNYLDNRHQFTMHLTSANHAYPLTENNWKMINDPSIPFKDMSFLYNVKTQRTESLVVAFFAILKSAMAGDLGVHQEEVSGFKDNIGTLQLIQATGADTFRVRSTVSDATVGIEVGTGITAVTLADHSLETLITDGTTAGKLQYGSTKISALFLDTSETSFRISRSMGNGTGSTITPTEVGLIANCDLAAGGSPANFLIERTLRTSTVLDGENLLEAYSFKITT